MSGGIKHTTSAALVLIPRPWALPQVPQPAHAANKTRQLVNPLHPTHVPVQLTL